MGRLKANYRPTQPGNEEQRSSEVRRRKYPTCKTIVWRTVSRAWKKPIHSQRLDSPRCHHLRLPLGAFQTTGHYSGQHRSSFGSTQIQWRAIWIGRKRPKNIVLSYLVLCGLGWRKIRLSQLWFTDSNFWWITTNQQSYSVSFELPRGAI